MPLLIRRIGSVGRTSRDRPALKAFHASGNENSLKCYTLGFSTALNLIYFCYQNDYMITIVLYDKQIEVLLP